MEKRLKRTLIVVSLLLTGPVFIARAQVDSLHVSREDTARAVGNAGWVTLRSKPEGAEVFLDTVFLGKTPLARTRLEAGRKTFRLFYPGVGTWEALVATDSITVHGALETTSYVEMGDSVLPGPRRMFTPSTQTNPDLFLSTPGHADSKLWVGYGAGATMVISGILSAYLKNKSDGEFDSYVATGDPGLLSSTQRLDRLAGISLFVTELSLGVLIYLLLAD